MSKDFQLPEGAVELDIDAKDQVFVYVDDYRGKTYIHIRKCYVQPGKGLQPGKGFSMPADPDAIEQLIGALEVIISE